MCDNLRNQLNYKTKLVNDLEKAFKKQTYKVSDLEEALKKQTCKVSDLEEALRNQVDDETQQQSITEGSDRQIDENLRKVCFHTFVAIDNIGYACMMLNMVM